MFHTIIVNYVHFQSLFNMAVLLIFICDLVLTSEEASLIAMEYDLNPLVNSEAAIDLFPKYS